MSYTSIPSLNTKSSSKQGKRARLRSLQAEFLPPASIAAHLSSSDLRNPLMRHTLMHSIVSFAPAADISFSSSRQLVCIPHAACRMMLTTLLRLSRNYPQLIEQPIAPTTPNIDLSELTINSITLPPGSRLLTHILYPRCFES